MGCGPAFTIRLDEPLGEPGSYQIAAVAEDGEHRCEYDVPLVPENLARDCGALYLGFDASGALAVIESPRVARLSLTIVRDGVVVASKAFAPKYSFEELNGPGCGTCASASGRL